MFIGFSHQRNTSQKHLEISSSQSEWLSIKQTTKNLIAAKTSAGEGGDSGQLKWELDWKGREVSS